MQRGKSFVLNLILIMVIVVALTLILFPMLARTHCSARKSCCQSNLKSIAQALKMYADDYNGQLPSSCLVSQAEQWNKRDFMTFATKLGKVPPESRTRKQTWSQVLYDNLRNKVLFCPSDPVEQADPNAQTSYWYKLANDKAWYGIGCPKPRRHLDDYGYESDQIAFYEHLGWHFGDTTGLHNNVQINASYMDTHVETIVLTNATSGDPLNCAANSNGEPMYYNTITNETTRSPKTHPGPAQLTDPTQCYDNL
jgi:competence protein ComGC